MSNSDIIGRGVPRVDALGKVTGQTRYAGDFRVAGMQHGKLVFARYPRANVVTIDTSAAQRMPGVTMVITARDLPAGKRWGYDVAHRPVLVGEGEQTRYLGDVVAMVVAETDELAARAAAAVAVHYEVLPPLTAPRQAMAPGAYEMHAEAPGNRCCTREFKHGDVAAGFAAADVVVEHTYFTPRQEQAFLETEAGVAWRDDMDVLHVYSSLQDPYGVADDIHLGLGLPKAKIHIKGTPVGGGFGGKLHTTIQVHLAAMAWLARVPVMLVLEREESFIFHAKRHPTEIRLKLGARRDGTLLALEGEVIADAGPYSGRSPEVVGLTMSALPGPYRVPNIATRAQAIYTNNLDSGAFRGYGAPQAAIARECLLDKLARKLGLDPLELRRRNFLQPGDRPASTLFGDSPVSLAELTERVLQKMGSPPPPAAPHIRVGRSICFDMPVFDVGAIPVLGKAGVGATVEVQSDGGISVHAGGTELGQGITTILAQMAAEQFGVGLDAVNVEMSDNWGSPRAGRTSASRLTFGLGNALLLASAPLRKTLLSRAAQILERPIEDLELADGLVKSHSSPERTIRFAEVAKACSDRGDCLREEGWFRSGEDRYMYGHTFMAAGADVSVDTETGEIEVLKLVNVLDMGKVLNPVMAYGQLYGGAMQSLGFGLMEDMRTEGSVPKTPSFAEYVIPTALDAPVEYIADAVEQPYPTGPYGAKGIAEAALNCTTPTLLNAINAAIGVDVDAVPVDQEKVLMALRRRKSEVQRDRCGLEEDGDGSVQVPRREDRESESKAAGVHREFASAPRP